MDYDNRSVWIDGVELYESREPVDMDHKVTTISVKGFKRVGRKGKSVIFGVKEIYNIL